MKSVSVKKRAKAVSAAVICMLLVSVLSVSAGAAAKDSRDQTAALTVECVYADSPIEGVRFGIFKIADVGQSGELLIAQEFLGYNFDFDQSSASGLRDLAVTLDVYITRDKIGPLAEALTDPEGRARFTDLAEGVYLVRGERYSTGEFTYAPEPFLVTLPRTGEDGEPEYDVHVSCKGEATGFEIEYIELIVVKEWQDTGTTAVRPRSITVQLLCDGEIYDTVVLDAENGWYHLWRGLEVNHLWQAAEEKIPDDYKLLISREGWTFVIKNNGAESITELMVRKIWDDAGNEDRRPRSVSASLLCDGEVRETVVLNEENGWRHDWDNLDSSHTWTVREESVPAGYYAEISEEGTVFTIKNTYKPIPSTGQPWWPVPLFVCLGAVFISAGLILKKARASL